MGQTSGPLTDQLFTDEQWRLLIGDEPGVLSDVDGSAYGLTLPSSSNVVQVGSTTQRSAARVAGFAHAIPAGDYDVLTVPESVGGAVIHKIVLRYDPAWAGTAPGPVRLYLLSGSPGGGAPVSDGGYPGVEDLPLWQLSRAPGQALSQVTPVDLRAHQGPTIHVLSADRLPMDVPIGTTAHVGRDGRDVRVRVVTNATTGAVDWVRMRDGWTPRVVPGAQLVGPSSPNSGFILQTGTVAQSTDAAGWAGITFPEPFPNGLLSIVATNGDSPAAPGMWAEFGWAAGGAYSTARAVYGLRDASGVLQPNRQHRLNWMAVGW